MFNQALTKIFPQESKGATLELILLTLCLLVLPSLEAPKNIFLWLYLTLATSNRLTVLVKIKQWKLWDSIFSLLLVSILLAGTGAHLPQLERFSGLADPISGVLLAWTIARSNYQAETAKFLIGVAILSVLPPLSYGLWQLYISHQKTTLELHSVGHVNHSAIYLSILFGVSLSYLASFWKTKKWWHIPITSILLIAIVISDSRGAVGISFFTGAALFILLFKRPLKFIGLGTIFATATLLVVFNASVVKKQIDNQQANNVLSFRDRVWNVSIEAAKINPVFGVGLNQWGKVTPDVIKEQLVSKKIPYDENNFFYPGHGHSIYFNTLAERGILGILGIALLMLVWLYSLVRSYNSSNKNYLLWGSSFSVWLVTFGLGAVNTTLHHEHGLLSYLILGLFLSSLKSK